MHQTAGGGWHSLHLGHVSCLSEVSKEIPSILQEAVLELGGGSGCFFVGK